MQRENRNAVSSRYQRPASHRSLGRPVVSLQDTGLQRRIHRSRCLLCHLRLPDDPHHCRADREGEFRRPGFLPGTCRADRAGSIGNVSFRSGLGVVLLDASGLRAPGKARPRQRDLPLQHRILVGSQLLRRNGIWEMAASHMVAVPRMAVLPAISIADRCACKALQKQHAGPADVDMPAFCNFVSVQHTNDPAILLRGVLPASTRCN